MISTIVIQYNYNATQYKMQLQYNAIQYNYNTIQYKYNYNTENKIPSQCNKIQYNAIQ